MSPPGAISAGAGRPARILTVVVTAVFMVTLDNLVVTTALAVIRGKLDASLGQLEWVVNAYTVSFAAFMLLSSAVADRLGHRTIFLAGLTIFTAASAAAALSPTIGVLITARAVQGVGAAVVLPLSLTLLAAAFSADRRGLALGIWSGISGLGVAVGPLVGGALVQAASWQAIFWLNVPVGIALTVLAAVVLPGSDTAARTPVDLIGAVLVTGGLIGVLVALVGVQHAGWLTAQVLVPLLSGVALLAAFATWQSRAPEPLLPRALLRSPTIATVNATNVAMYFGMFGAIFLLAPFLQIVLGDSPWEAGVRILPWTLMPLFLSPLVGVFTTRIGARALVVAGMGLQAAALAWIAVGLGSQMPGWSIVGPCILGGVGMALVYPPISAALLDAVEPAEVNRASAVMNSARETGGAIGIATLATLFVAAGGTAEPAGYVAGLRPALYLGAVALLAGAVVAVRLPGPTMSGADPRAIPAHPAHNTG